jgi:D-alanyl-D-alanine carboxypeptidase (penicillin-binding protein 5/6)
MKKWIGLVLAVALFLCPAMVSRAEFDYETIPTPVMLVVDADDITQVFYERNADQKAYPASTTKIMTALLALEDGNLDDEFMVGQEIEGTTIKFTSESSLMGLQIGEMVTLRDLVYGLMLVSGNDAGEAIARHVSGTVDNFVALMNQKAQALGMSGTHFTNPHGVHNDNHFTTARDLAKLTAYALQNKDFCEIMSTLSYTMPANNIRTQELVLVNTNRLLRAVEGDTVNTVYPYAIGVKTGDTDKAGKCIVAAAERDGARVICILLGDTTEHYGGDKVTTNLARFVNAGSIFTEVFENKYETVAISELGLATSFTTPVENGRDEDLVDNQLPVSAQLGTGLIRALPSRIANYKSSKDAIAAETVYYGGEMPKAPVTAGEVVGEVSYTLGGKTLFTAPLVSDMTVIEVAAVDNIDTTPPMDDPAFAPTSTPLLSRNKIPSSQKILMWVMLLLIILLIALVIVFIVTERKRKRREAERRRRQAARRNRY